MYNKKVCPKYAGQTEDGDEVSSSEEQVRQTVMLVIINRSIQRVCHAPGALL